MHGHITDDKKRDDDHLEGRLVIDRATGEATDSREPSGSVTDVLYGNPVARLVASARPVQRVVSRAWATAMSHPSSASRIAPFVEEHGVDMTGCPPVSSYSSFAEFFARPKDASVEAEPGDVVSPADSKSLAIPVSGGEGFRVEAKGTVYSLPQLMGGEGRPCADWLPAYLDGGTCLVFRLSLTDWHRFLFPFSGRRICGWDVEGSLHSVRRVADGARPYSTNRRHVDVLAAGCVAHPTYALMVEVGALLVGGIRQEQTDGDGTFAAGDEKGRFELGGSTVILVVPTSVEVDGDLLRNSQMGNETAVRAGERVGRLTAGR